MSDEEVVRALREARGGRLIGGVRSTLLHAWEERRAEPSLSDVAVWAWALRHDIELTRLAGEVAVRGELYCLRSSESAKRAAVKIAACSRIERRRRRLSKVTVAARLGIQSRTW